MKNQLSTLSTLHYVYGAFLCVAGLALLGLVFAGMFLNSGWLQEQGAQAPPLFLGAFLSGLGWLLFILVEAHGVLNLLSGARLAKQRGRTFSQVVAAVNCLNFPFGTALGVFTFVVLGDRDVQMLYGIQEQHPGSMHR